MGFLSDLDPTYSKGAAGKLVQGGMDYLVNPFVSASVDAFEWVGNKLIEALTPSIDYADRKINTRNPATPQRVIYGTARVGAQVIPLGSNGKDSRYLHMVYIFAAHPCEEIVDIYIDNTLSTDPKFNGLLTIEKSTDGLGNVPTELSAHLDSLGKSNYYYKGKTYAYIKFKYNEDAFQGQPQVTAVIRGKNNIYDPRDGQYKYTNNAALCELDWLTNYIGGALTDYNTDSVIAAANVSEELVAAANGATEPRFALNGTIALEGSKVSAITRMAANCGIQPVNDKASGEWVLVPSVYQEPAVDAVITSSDFISGLQIKVGEEKGSKINTITGTYIDADNNYEAIEFPSIQTPTFLQEDKEPLEKTVDFALVNSGTQCRRIAKIMLEQSRRGFTVIGQFNFKMLDYKVGDRVTLNLPEIGIENKVMMIVERDIDPIAGVNMVLREDSPEIYSWEEGDALATIIPEPLNLPDPSFVLPPENIVISEELYATNVASNIKTRALISWSEVDFSTEKYQVQGSYQGGDFVVFSDYVRGTSTRIEDVKPGEWIFRVRAVNSIGAVSEWLSGSYTVAGKNSPPADVPSLTAIQKSHGVEISWQAVPDADLQEYELRIDENFGDAGAIYSGRQLRFTDIRRPEGTVYYIKALDTTGNYSQNSVMFNPDIQPPAQVGFLNVSTQDNYVELRWATSESTYPIAYYSLWRGTDFNTAVLLGEVTGTFHLTKEEEAGVYTYWVQPVDASGAVGVPRSSVANVDAAQDYILRRDDYVDFELMDTLTNVAIGSGGGGFKWDDETLSWSDETLRWDDGPSLDLLGPVNNTETFLENMARSGLTNEPYGQKIANGFDHFLDPPVSSGVAERIIDFEALIPSTRITVTVESVALRTTATLTTTLSTSSDGISWDDFPANQLDINSANFRYLKINHLFENDLTLINSVRFRLDVKQKTDQGQAQIFAADTDGTEVFLNKAFVDIDSVVATPRDENGKILAVTFEDIGNQDRFVVRAFDRATGARVDAIISWIVRGS